MKAYQSLCTTIGIILHSSTTSAIGVDDNNIPANNSPQGAELAEPPISTTIESLPAVVAVNPSRQTTQTTQTQTTRECKLDEPTPLSTFPQWQEEVGYWIGDLSFFGADGMPFQSTNKWNYRYDNYKGFITGNIKDVSYRQRNVFLYPPQTSQACASDDSTSGNGICGINGNSKIFFADQSADGASCDGSIGGSTDPFANNNKDKAMFDKTTTLVGRGNAVLYQVYYQGKLFQNQITTLSGKGRRTRSAHQFAPFPGVPNPEVPTACSFYRERRVSREEFYDALESTLGEYRVLDEDACSWSGEGKFLPEVVGGLDACRAHLEESFEL
mmetsp:Transcript_31693/g.67109  ORF Transcript_31693/g.67109 Transcript_31693/m.67109 type:complete len:328 (+) Transcript_31693:29-1012(+)